MSTAEIKRHWDKIASFGCMVCLSKPATIHHCHGGSMLVVVQKGVGQKTSDWLTIPLCPDHHTGPWGIDNGMGAYKSVEMWEEQYGPQLGMLHEIVDKTGINVFARAVA